MEDGRKCITHVENGRNSAMDRRWNEQGLMEVAVFVGIKTIAARNYHWHSYIMWALGSILSDIFEVEARLPRYAQHIRSGVLGRMSANFYYKSKQYTHYYSMCFAEEIKLAIIIDKIHEKTRHPPSKMRHSLLSISRSD